MRTIEIEEIEVGDEIAIACQSYFKYLKVLRKPALGTRTHWRTKQTLYKTVKCSTRRREVEYTYTNWRGDQVTRTQKEWEFTPDDHNLTTYINLNDRHILLIKKANENV
jgi:hypothetical protein